MAIDTQEASALLQEALKLVPHHLFSVKDYEVMGEIGIFQEDDRVELINGEVLVMAPIGDRHAAVVGRLVNLFRHLPDEAVLWVQNPLRLSGVSSPEPDVALIRPRDDHYDLGKPGPADVQCIVEVADSSLQFDRAVKLPLYAIAGIPEVWLVNLVEETIEVNLEPRGGAYVRRMVLPRGSALAPAAFPEARFSVDEILGTPAPPTG